MKAAITVILLLFLISCTTKLYVPSDVNVNKRETATLADLQQGHDLFAAKCGRCHKLPKPEKHVPAEWTKVLQKMAPKEKLTAEQKDLVFKYLSNY